MPRKRHTPKKLTAAAQANQSHTSIKCRNGRSSKPDAKKLALVGKQGPFRALCEIQKYQKMDGRLILRAPFERLASSADLSDYFQAVWQQLWPSICSERASHASEAYLVTLMEDAYRLAIHARRRHYMPSNHSGLQPVCPLHDNLNVSNLTDKFVPTNPNKRKQLITAEDRAKDEDNLDPNDGEFIQGQRLKR
ncbi:hypothetical protein BDR26DRAFT_931141 [Obelidium mucronatum]|nr:hypothetical protein BDR26DRAFT_931141 [Obelidium mucronatum]